MGTSSDEPGTRVPDEVEISRPEKVFFPSAGVTKGDLAEYYGRVAELLLPHLRDRPLVMERFPDGIDGEGWFQKEVSRYFPAWVRRASLAKRDGTVRHVVVDDTPTLVYLADQAVITPHVWLSRVDRPRHPDQLVIDLDPGDDPHAVPRVARMVKAVLDDLELPAFAKSSGSRGIHIHVPLDRSADFEQANAFARALADVVAGRAPDSTTTEFRKAERGGRLFLDVQRNAYAQHAVAPYGVRPLPEAPVAIPLDWDEATDPGFDARRITVANVFRRLAQKADPWAGFDARRTRLAAAASALQALLADVPASS